MTLLLTVLAFFFMVILVVALGAVISHRRIVVRDRLVDIRKMNVEADPEDMLRLSFMARVIIPLLSGMGHALGSVAPREIQSKMEKRIIYAGTPWNLNFQSLIVVQILLCVSCLVLSVFLIRLVQIEGFRLIIPISLLIMIGFFLPVGVINSKGEARQKKIRRSLPDMFDLLLISVEAGLGFDMALQKITQKMPGPLSEEIRRALDEIRMGSTREAALRGIARRTSVGELSSFISAVIQTEELGTSINGTLRAQADYMRQKRRQNAEEIAMKAPVKLIFPLLFFIFPALFVVILGPAVIRIIKMFSTLL